MSVLPPQEQKVAALPARPQPIASFTRSNSGSMVNVSLPEAATQFRYGIGDRGEFTDGRLLDALDQRTGMRCQRPVSDGPDQGKDDELRHLARKWRQADVVPINFDPSSALTDEQKKILEQFWTSWVAFHEYNGMVV